MPPKRKSTEEAGTAGPNDAPNADKRSKTDSIPRTLPWMDNRAEKVYLFIGEMEKLENFKILFGKKEKGDVRYSS